MGEPSPPASSADGPSSFLLRAGLLIDGHGGEPLVDATIRVEGGRIAAVGRSEEFGSALAAAAVVDFSGQVVMPGMVDCHAHLTLPADRRPFEEQLLAPDSLLVLTALRQMQVHVRSGVTFVRDCGARGRTMFIVREALERGYVAGPRLQLAGRAITHSLGHLHWTGSVADGPDEIRREVRKLVAEGADVIKIIASGGGTRGGIPYRASYTVAELRVAVETAHALGRATVAHCRATESIERCVEAGVDTIAHLEFLSPGPIVALGGGAPTGLPCFDQRVAEKLAASGAWLDLNPQSSGWDAVVLLRRKAEQQGLDAAEREQLANLERYFEHMLAVIASLRELGLVDRMGFGADAGPFDTEFGHLDYNVHLARLAGLSPMESLQVVTRNAARLCGRGDMVGTIEVGKAADLLVLEGDPLEDVANLTRVAAVFLAGRRVA